MNIYILHPPTLNNPVTYLSADKAAAVTSLSVKNTDGFVQNKFAVLGTIGFEQAEIVTLGAPTPPSTLATSSTVFPHNAGDKITQIDFNQIKVYRSTTGINGAYSLVTTLDIDISHDVTTYSEDNANTTYYYKFAYFNSATSTEDTLSDPVSASGFVFYSLKTMTDRVLSLFGDSKAEFVTRDEIKDWLTEIYEKAQRDLAIATKRLNISTQIISLAADDEDYGLNADFLIEKAVKISTDGGSTYPYVASYKPIDGVGGVYQNNIRYTYRIQGDEIIFSTPSGGLPANSTDKAKLYYVPTPYTLSNQTDTVISPFVNATAMFVKYALGMCHLKTKTELGTTLWEKLTGAAKAELADFITYVKKMQNLHLQYAELTDDRFV